MIEIEDPGPRCTIQDLGRPGYAALGVGRSGAADRASLCLANRLVANREDAACLESTLGGLRVRFRRDATIAVTGAPCPLEIDGRAAAMDTPTRVRAGQVLALGRPHRLLRSYLAVRGGIDVPRVLGSRSTDTLSGIGPEAVTVGVMLPIGHETSGFPLVDLAVRRTRGSGGDPDAEVPLRLAPGPRADWFSPDALAQLTQNPYTVTAEADRVGVRMSGPVLERARREDFPPEGMVAGAIQVPPAGLPILFLADHPVTGGYPVIAVVRTDDLDSAGQLRPGDRVRFRFSSAR